MVADIAKVRSTWDLIWANFLRGMFCSCLGIDRWVIPAWMKQVVQAELARVPRHLSDALSAQLWSIIYMPQVGACLFDDQLITRLCPAVACRTML